MRVLTDYCGVRAAYYKHHTGLCRLEEGHDGEHLVEVVSTPNHTVDYTKKREEVGMQLYPHQRDALERMKNGCVLNGGVGTGKTLTALAYFVEKVCGGDLTRERPMERPRKLIVITTARKRDDLDWFAEALHFGVFEDPAISYGGVEMVVDSWNNIKKYADEHGCFFIFDEQRLVGSGAWVKAFLNIARKNQWVLLSATPADTWMDYIPVFVANGFYRNRTEFVEEHVIWTFKGTYRQVRGFYGVRRLEGYRNSVLVEMPYERHTTRHLVVEEVDHDRDLFRMVWNRRWNIYTNEPLIDAAEMYRVSRKLVNTDPSRLDTIERLSREHPRMIIYYTFDYELQLLRTLMTRLDIPVCEWNGHVHQEIPGTDRWLYLVQYTAGAEAWNCVETNVIVYYSLTYSHKVFEQSQGRIDRLDTPFEDLWYYVLKSDSQIDKLIWKSVSMKKSFHEGRNVKFKTDIMGRNRT